jgi:hypothetical protein
VDTTKEFYLYLFLWSVPEQKLDFFTAYMVAFFSKTCPYKITERKIIKVAHNIIDSSRCLIIIVYYIFAIFQESQNTSFLRNFFDDRINTLQTKCVLRIHFIFEERIKKKKISKNFFFAFLPALPSIDLSICLSITDPMVQWL